MTMRAPLDPKTPDEEKDYGIDWTDQLDGATITASSWVLPSGISSSGDDIDGATAVIRVTGGTAGQNYTLLNAVELSNGEQLEDVIEIRVRTPTSRAGI